MQVAEIRARDVVLHKLFIYEAKLCWFLRILRLLEDEKWWFLCHSSQAQSPQNMQTE